MPTIHIEHLQISLHGVSTGIADAAVAALGPALERRLGAADAAALVAGGVGIGDLSLRPIDVRPGIDPSALAALIAESLVDALGVQSRRDADHEVGEVEQP